jgi:hypothetical protein
VDIWSAKIRPKKKNAKIQFAMVADMSSDISSGSSFKLKIASFLMTMYSRNSLSGTAFSGRKHVLRDLICGSFSVRSDSFHCRMCNIQRDYPVSGSLRLIVIPLAYRNSIVSEKPDLLLSNDVMMKNNVTVSCGGRVDS